MTLFMNTLALINFDLIKRTEDLVGVVVWARIRSLFQGASSTRLRLLLLSQLLLLVNLLTSRWRVAPFAVWRRSWQPEAAEWKSSKLSTAASQKSSSLSLCSFFFCCCFFLSALALFKWKILFAYLRGLNKSTPKALCASPAHSFVFFLRSALMSKQISLA